MEVNRCPYCMEEMGRNTICPYCHKDSTKAENPPYALPYNTILHGKYLVGSVLGQGGFGITYIGFDFSLEMKVAIKEYYPQNIASRENNTVIFHSISLSDKNQWAVGKEQFLIEARKMAKMNSIESIVSVRETFYENNTAYIVMDYVPGVSLKQFLKKNGVLTFKECVELMLPIIDGLGKAHAAGMIHRDISPDNIMLSPDGRMYLLDMGAAKDLRNKDDQGAHVVKMGFSPLEQFQGGDEIGPWSDIYALCATIYYATLGRMVPDALTRAKKESLTFEGGRKPLTKKQIAVLEKGLALHKETRIQSAVELGTLLRKCIEQENKKHGNKKMLGVIAGVVGVAAATAVIAGAIVMAPWAPSVEEFGCPNTNMIQESDFQQADDYEYYMGLDDDLYVIPRNEEDQVFYIEDAVSVDDRVGSINVGKSKVYFLHDQAEEDGDHDSIQQMDFDGSNKKIILEQDSLVRVQYVQLSNSKEYLYYLSCTDEDYSYELYRYDLGTGEKKLIQEKVYWFNLYDRYLYYSTFDGQNPYDYCALHRAFLDGSRDKILDDQHELFEGYVVDGNIYMESLTQEKMMQVDESQKNQVTTIGGNYSKDICMGASVYGDGWFYYSVEGSSEIDRVMADGSGQEVVTHVAQNVYRMNYLNRWLYTIEGTYDELEGEYTVTSSSLIFYDGSASISLADGNTGDFTYKVVDGEAYITGYTGESEHVAIPTSIDGYPLNTSNAYVDDSLDGVVCHIEIPEDELTYEEVDGGICITGYTPGMTADYANLAIPAEIDGKPVVEIGEGAFSNKDKEEGEEYSFSGMIIPDTVQFIDAYAFYLCESLEYINIPSELKKLDLFALYSCPLTDLEIVFPDGMQSIGSLALAYSKIQSVYLPDSVEQFGEMNPFAGCGQTTGEFFLINSGSEKFCVDSGVLYNADKTIIYAVNAANTGDFNIPDSVCEIKEYAFHYVNYDLIEVPSSVTDYDYGFFGCYMNQVILGEGMTEIPEGAFEMCTSLLAIDIPNTVKMINNYAFYICSSLDNLVIRSDCSVADYSFADSIDIREEVVSTSDNPPKISVSVTSVELTGTDSATITYTVGGDLPNSYYLNGRSSGSGFEAAWEGDWYNDNADLKITGLESGQGSITVCIVDSNSEEIVAHVNVVVKVTE